MGKFSLSRLIMCAKYQRLTSEDYLRLGLCDPDSCPDCSDGHGHYVKNDKVMKNNLLLNNQLAEDNKLCLQSTPLKTIVNNLRGEENNIACNKCKELVNHQKHPACTAVATAKDKVINNNNKGGGGGVVNLAFVDQVTESASWYQPYLSRELAVKVLADCPVGSFIVRHSQTHMSAGCLALTVRVPRSYNGTGILHYLVLVSEAGFRIKGFSKVFPSLPALVVHHSVMKENLPCRLLVVEEDAATTANSESDRDSDFADLDSDPEFPFLISRLREQLAQ